MSKSAAVPSSCLHVYPRHTDSYLQPVHTSLNIGLINKTGLLLKRQPTPSVHGTDVKFMGLVNYDRILIIALCFY